MFDPFCSDLPLFHPKRLSTKALTIASERICRMLYERCALPLRVPDGCQVQNATSGSSGLSTTAEQRALLAHLLDLRAKCEEPCAVIELGAWEGETTAFLASRTNSQVIAVDRYFEGWPPAAAAERKFHENVGRFQNVRLIRDSTVSAARSYGGDPAGLIFVDAQHNFLNTYTDVGAWLPHALPGAYIAFHDVDSRPVPGTRVAARWWAKRLPIYAHINNLLVLCVPRDRLRAQRPAA